MLDGAQGHVKTAPSLNYCLLVVKVQVILQALYALDNVLMSPLYVSNGSQGTLSLCCHQ